MKAERQSIHLAKMMQKHQHYPEYELALPLFQVKQKRLKKLAKGDVLLLGYEVVEMILLQEGKVCAQLSFHAQGNSRTLKIGTCSKMIDMMPENKKYAVVKCSFGMIQSRVIEPGHKIDISAKDLSKTELIVKEKSIAKGTLVSVDDEIAIAIDEVNE